MLSRIEAALAGVSDLVRNADDEARLVAALTQAYQVGHTDGHTEAVEFRRPGGGLWAN